MGDEAESAVVRVQSAREDSQAVSRNSAGLGVLQRFEAVKNEKRAVLADESGEALALLPRAGVAGSEVWVAEEFQGFLEEQVV